MSPNVVEAIKSIFPIMTAVVLKDEFSQNYITDDIEDTETMAKWLVGLINFNYLLLLHLAALQEVEPLEIIRQFSQYIHMEGFEDDA